MSEGYKIERIDNEKLKDLLPLYKDAFGKIVSLKYFKDKFDTEVFGAAYIGYIAYADEMPAAYYGLFPCSVMYEGQVLLCATSGDTMTHSAHRGKGLFLELAKRTYLLAKESGIKFAFGFPNQNSLKGSIDLGWQYKGDHLRMYELKVSTLPLAKLKKKLGLNQMESNEGQDFPNSIGVDGQGCVLHDADFFKYKEYSPKSIQVLVGSRVWMKMDGVLKIGDVERIDNFSIKKFLIELKRFALWKGISQIQFMVSNDTWLDKELSSCLKGIDAFQVGHFHFDSAGMDLSKMKYGMSDLDTF